MQYALQTYHHPDQPSCGVDLAGMALIIVSLYNECKKNNLYKVIKII